MGMNPKLTVKKNLHIQIDVLKEKKLLIYLVYKIYNFIKFGPHSRTMILRNVGY